MTEEDVDLCHKSCRLGFSLQVGVHTLVCITCLMFVAPPFVPGIDIEALCCTLQHAKLRTAVSLRAVTPHANTPLLR
jgi:hypothetical protein